MTRFLLDTNIISDAVKPKPSEALAKWMQAQDDDRLFISSITIAEVRRGILERPSGRKRAILEAWFASAEGPQALFSGRVLPFDESAALEWARLMAEERARGMPRGEIDTFIAAIALVNDCVVVSDNDKDFAGVRTLNLLRDAPAPS